MLKIAFRCDASTQIGSGHVMRCLTFANELREQGADITFVCREYPGNLFGLIEDSNHRLLRLPCSSVSHSEESAHVGWLGGEQAEDARQMTEMLKTVGQFDWIVVDHYALDISWEVAIRPCTIRIMVVDDLADRAHDCDILLDQNLRPADKPTGYEKLLPPHTRKLLGPKYALLRPEFTQARDNPGRRDGNVKRIFVFFGGSDLTNETGKALRAIQRFGRLDIAVDVVVGSANPHREEIADLCRGFANVIVHCQVQNIAGLMNSADIAIGAGGGTMWERCCLGLPTIVLSIAENQQSGCNAIAELGAALYLGDSGRVGVELIEAALHVVTSSWAFQASMREKCMALVDGRGAKRVARQLVLPELSLRPATLADCEPIFSWRNAEETRQFSNGSSPISMEQHRAWFSKSLGAPDRQLLIGESTQQPVGVVRFDREGARAIISIYLVPGNYGRGMGGRLIEQGTAWVKQCWPEVKSIEALIKDENHASIAAFSEAGFTRMLCTYVKEMGN